MRYNACIKRRTSCIGCSDSSSASVQSVRIGSYRWTYKIYGRNNETNERTTLVSALDGWSVPHEIYTHAFRWVNMCANHRRKKKKFTERINNVDVDILQLDGSKEIQVKTKTNKQRNNSKVTIWKILEKYSTAKSTHTHPISICLERKRRRCWHIRAQRECVLFLFHFEFVCNGRASK